VYSHTLQRAPDRGKGTFSQAYHGGDQEDAIAVEIGARLLQARRERGLSVRALAAEVGVSGALISQIETGRTQPSVSTLYALVEHLGVSLDWLVGRDEVDRRAAPAAALAAGRPVTPAGEHPVLRIANGVSWEVAISRIDGSVDAVLVSYEPGASSSDTEEAAVHTGHEHAVLVVGELTLVLDGERHAVRAGDSISFDSSRPHRYVNEGTVPARGVWLSSGQDYPG